MVMKELLNQLGDLQLSLLISNKVDRNFISNEWVISYLGKFHATMPIKIVFIIYDTADGQKA